VAPDARSRAAVEECLRASGFLLLDGRDFREETGIGLVSAELVITPAEAQVLDALALQMRSQEIAALLGVSTRTVDNHIYHLAQKLGVGCRHCVVQRASALGLLSRPTSFETTQTKDEQ